MLEPFKRGGMHTRGLAVGHRAARGLWHIPRECMPGAYTTGSRECVLVPLWRLVGMAAGLTRNMGRTEHCRTPLCLAPPVASSSPLRFKRLVCVSQHVTLFRDYTSPYYAPHRAQVRLASTRGSGAITRELGSR